MKKTIIRIVCCLLIVALAFGISWAIGKGISPNAEGQIQHTHEFGEWQITTEPTCTEPGQETRICECGYFEKHEIKALGHTCQVGICDRCGAKLYHDVYCGMSKKISSSCQESKHITGICDGCGEEYDVEIIPFDHEKFLYLYTEEDYITEDNVIRCPSTSYRDTRVSLINRKMYLMSSWFYADYPNIVATPVGDTDIKIICGTCGLDITSICFPANKAVNPHSEYFSTYISNNP